MPRRSLKGSAGLVFHVVNRGVRRMRLFEGPQDYRAFLAVLQEAQVEVPIRLLAYCLMPNHFHLVLWPDTDTKLTVFMHWLTSTHSKRWHAWRKSVGTGPVYQGRFRAFPVQQDVHLLNVCRYVERNALKAGLVSRAEDWPWSSLSERCRKCTTVDLATWPIPQPLDWLTLVNSPLRTGELDAIRLALRRSLPLGIEAWRAETAEHLGLKLKAGTSGRPPKGKKTTPGVGFTDFVKPTPGVVVS